MIIKIVKGWQILRNRKLSRDALDELRNRKLRILVQHAYENVPFYRELFHAAGLSSEDIQTVDDLKKIPVTKKDNLRSAGLDNVLAKGVDVSTCYKTRTNGSTGEPFTTYFNRQEYWIRRLLGFRRILEVGFRPQDRLCVICDPVQLRGNRFRTKCISPLLPVKEQLASLKKIQPTILKAWPSVLRVLFNYTNDRLGEFIRPRAIITSGEACDDSLKKSIQKNMNVEMFNFYNAGEFGPIASECPAHEGLHVNDDQLILECLNNGEPAKPGEPGAVVITNFNNFAMPFIRYCLGDISTFMGRPCSCGSNFPLIKPPIGEQADVIQLPHGKMLSVSALVNVTLRPFYKISQFRLIQETLHEFLLQVVLLEPGKLEVTSQIRSRIVECLGESAKLDIQIVDLIEENKLCKFSSFISKIPKE